MNYALTGDHTPLLQLLYYHGVLCKQEKHAECTALPTTERGDISAILGKQLETSG